MLLNNQLNLKKYRSVSIAVLICWCIYMVAYLNVKNSSFHYYPGVLALVGQVMCDGIAFTIVFLTAKEVREPERKVLMWFGLSFLCAFFADGIYNVLVNVLAISNITTFLDSLFDVPFLGFLIFQVFGWWAIVKGLFKDSSLKNMSHIYIPTGIFGTLIALVFTFAFQWKINATSIMGLYQIGDTICEIIGFIFAVLCFTTAQTWILRVLATGYLTIITSDFVIRTGFIEKSVIPENLFEAIWVLGLILMILGLWGIKLEKSKIQNWLYKSNSIQVQCASWAFAFCLLIFLALVGVEDLLVSSKLHSVHFEGLAPILVVVSIFVLWGSYLFSKRLFQPLQAIEAWINKNKFDTSNQNYKTLEQDYGVMEYNKLADFIKQSFSELKHTVEANAELSLEKVKAESDGQKKLLKEQEQFRNIVGQMLHDVGAPLSTLRMTVDSTTELPENKRITLRGAANNITDITSHLLNYYRPNNAFVSENNAKQVVLISTLLNEAFGDRRYNYKNLPITFKYNLTGTNAFLFVKVEPSFLKRAISNIVNNAVDALPDKRGEIILKLTANEEWVHITILDDGKGMPKELVEKIKNDEAVTQGKKDGHGIGLNVVRDMVKANYGKFEVISSTNEKNHGTTINISLPRVLAPDWSIEEISLTPNDIIIILDDDTYIHDGWDSRLNRILEKLPNIKVKHFSQGIDVIHFVKGLSKEEQENICFLSDYELIGQELNGLQIIEQLEVKHPILVTSHYADVELRKIALQSKVRVLPKDLVHVIPINVKQSESKDGSVNVHLVFVDDEKSFTKTLISSYYSNLLTESYSNPLEFLDSVDKYPKDTRIVLDNYYYMEDGSTYKIDGVMLAEKLHEKGFTKLILLSGEEFSVPEYLTLILKLDKNKLSKLDQI